MKTKITLLSLILFILFFEKGNAQVYTNPTNGFVGIGTTSPLDRLHITGNLYVPPNSRIRVGTHDLTSGHLHIFNGGGPAYDNYLDYKGAINFRSQNSGGLSGTPLIIQADGTITMGVDDPWGNTPYNTQGYRLAINGGIICEEIKVILDVPQFDIVFESDYELSTLYEVEKYILKNKHLKDIPSAKEFREEGYKLGEMDGLLLKKTEELTLYLIQMRKEIDALKKQNEELLKLLELKQ